MSQQLRNQQIRVLIYSHGTFGLGHLRRSCQIAHALVAQYKCVQVLIISGSSIAGAFDFRARVDFIKIPSVVKLYSGEFCSLSNGIHLNETLALRRSIIEQTAARFRPDVFIVDQEPRGLCGELDPTLLILRKQGCHIILGLREVLDNTETGSMKWQEKRAIETVEQFYDWIWIYGPRDFWNPLNGLELPQSVSDKTYFVGFLGRRAPSTCKTKLGDKLPDSFILVTAGGGGEGASLMRQVLVAKETSRNHVLPLVMLLGPFVSLTDRSEIYRRAQRLPDVIVFDFDSQIETIMQKATAIVAIGGYNTFCEILSFDKRALLVPRKQPCNEQLIRAQRAAELGVLSMHDPDHACDPQLLAAALETLPKRRRPSQSGYVIDLDGLKRIGNAIGNKVPVPLMKPVDDTSPTIAKEVQNSNAG